MKIFVELLREEIPFKKGILVIDNRKSKTATKNIPKWEAVYAPIYKLGSTYSIQPNRIPVGRIYISKKDFLAKVKRVRVTKKLLNSPKADAVFANELKSALLS